MSATRLFDLLPTVYRLRDTARGGPLQALLELVSGQVDLLHDDLEAMWDDLFIETCAEWVVPYIGDLVANTPLYEVTGVGRRVDVASTIGWRRRKGTLAMLGDLARGVTGWGAHAVATFELLAWTQNLNHVRVRVASDDPGGRHPLALDRVGSVDLRDRDTLDRLDTAFDRITHTVDLRPITDGAGWYGLRKVCFFCFRLKSFPIVRMTPAPSLTGPAGCYHFGPLGQDAPVFHLGVPLASGQAFADETNVDAPIRPYRFYEQPQLDWGQTLAIHPGATEVPVADVICKDLSAWADVPPDKVGVDVRTGRLRFGSAYPLPGELRVDACHGFSAPIGGGPYSRSSATAPVPTGTLVLDVPGAFPDPASAVAHWLSLAPQDVRIVIADSATYQLASGALDLSRPGLTEPVGVTIAAADEQRPVLVGDLRVAGTLLHELALDGLLISGALHVSGAVQELAATDCTLVPGITLDEAGTPLQPAAASLTCDAPGDRRAISFERCITGPLRIPAEGNHLTVLDGIIDAPAQTGGGPRVALAATDDGQGAGPESDLERMTVFGSVHVRELTLASECIFTAGTLRAQRRQAGCVRFSSLVPEGSSTPRRYRCQPDLVRQAAPAPATAAQEEQRVRPSFSSVHYGQPAYGQLARNCAIEIRQGAQDGAEMGAFQSLLQPFRETNLRVRLVEYLPFGLEPGIVHVT